MGWETRGGRKYYYRKERDGGSVRSVYVGPGALGALAAKRDRQARRAAKAERRRLRRERVAGAALGAALDALAELTEEAAAAALMAAGFHRHKGQWRGRRDGEGESRDGAGDVEG